MILSDVIVFHPSIFICFIYYHNQSQNFAQEKYNSVAKNNQNKKKSEINCQHILHFYDYMRIKDHKDKTQL
ncbi:hypothetical protein DERP_008568 [Dermatophagoides pteronyssinus]|uniref:Uncharacterized protein n=1 Tax=Dermatophagoides pteronyssinus TaxID=6956 RepID=A0ABQ8IWN0_DERPT|nr:hypothetical protein DERP_008568 [Dermatophagoides pteronyssinus]